MLSDVVLLSFLECVLDFPWGDCPLGDVALGDFALGDFARKLLPLPPPLAERFALPSTSSLPERLLDAELDLCTGFLPSVGVLSFVFVVSVDPVRNVV